MELVLAWRAGDGDAAAALAERYFPAVLAYFKVRAPVAAHDLAQRTFLAAQEALPRFRGDSSFRTFLFSIARNLKLQHYEGRGRMPAWQEADSKLGQEGPSPSTAVRVLEAHNQVRNLVDCLPEEFREVVSLFYWDDMSVQEIAQLLKMPEGTVKSRLHRGRAILRRTLGAAEADQAS